MKKFVLGVALPLALAACDRPIDSTELVCLGSYGLTDEYTELGVMDVRFYDEYALVKIHDTEYKLMPDTDRNSTTAIYEEHRYVADIPGISDKLGIEYYINTRTGHVGYVVWIGNSGVSCAAPHNFRGNYRQPTELELCIDELSTLVSRGWDRESRKPEQHQQIRYNVKYIFSDGGSYTDNHNYYTIPADDAINLSPAWDYNSEIKDYRTGLLEGGTAPHEQDACDVLNRVRKYISDRGLDKTKEIKLDMTQEEYWKKRNATQL
ncbi:MAG: hypothetical protein NC311_09185 [Muribaculaceae bacterium]|nr:hypothetical protein [Muribaculaceae bacterium]